VKHEVKIYGRFLFWVSSASRKGMYHLVDLEAERGDDGLPLPGGEPFKCSCEAHTFNVEKPCRHVRAVVEYLRPVLEVLSKIDLAPAKPHEPPRSFQTIKLRKYQLDPNKEHDPNQTNP
jgi:hypothetical protein